MDHHGHVQAEFKILGRGEAKLHVNDKNNPRYSITTTTATTVIVSEQYRSQNSAHGQNKLKNAF